MILLLIIFLLFLQSVAEAAEDLWDRYGYDFETDYSGLFKALSHINYNVRLAAAEALAAALDECPDTIQVSLIYQTFDCHSRLLLLDNFFVLVGISVHFIFFVHP